MNRTFKIIGICPFSNTQKKKRLYTSESDYLKYKDELIQRYLTYMHVRCYELINDKWVLIHSEDYSGWMLKK